MSDWTAGYLTEIDYTHGYYQELSPAQLRFAALSRNIRVPDRPLRYLELGFGQGLSLNIHACTCPGEYWGTDFNPSQAANAQRLAVASGSGVKALDLSFADLAALQDLPEFDIITLHGIWSWINDENRAVLVDLFQKKLAVGGLLFISYNCYPGWAQTIPLRHLLSLHVDLAGSQNDGIISKIDKSLEFAQTLVNTGSLFFALNPAAKDRLDTLVKMDRHYVAHEYFNRDWHPMPFSRVAEQLAEAKLTYVGSGNCLDNLEVLNVNQAGRDFLSTIHHPVLQESVRDYLTNRQFRRDLFVKGPVRMPDHERNAILRQQAFVLTTPPDSVERRQLGTAGELFLPDGIYTPLLQILAEDDYAPKTLAQVEAHPLWPKLPFSILLESITLLMGKNAIYPVQSDERIEAARPACQSINRHLMRDAQYGVGGSYLASPVTGYGFHIGHYELMFLLGYDQGLREPVHLAAFVWNIFASKGISFNMEGRQLQTPQENIGYLLGPAEKFVADMIPRLRTLGIAE